MSSTKRESSSEEAKPLIKWAGGKRTLAPFLMERIGSIQGRYFEPFFGAGALFFRLKNSNPDLQAVISDNNESLMNFHQVLKDSPSDLFSSLEALDWQTLFGPVSFQRAKNRFNLLKSDIPNLRRSNKIELASLFYYLNKMGFNGLYRENKSGEFNVPVGRFVTPPGPPRRVSLEASSKALSHTFIRCLDFEEALSRTEPSDVVYADPPYDTLEGKDSFSSYTKGAFSWAEQERLAAKLSLISSRGVRVFATNHDTERIRELYTRLGFMIEPFEASRKIASNGNRDKAKEVLLSKEPS